MSACISLSQTEISRFRIVSDLFVGNATQQTVYDTNLTDASSFTGQTSYGGYTYQSHIQYTSGYLQNSSEGINHWASVGINGKNPTDGLVAVITVSVVGRPVKS